MLQLIFVLQILNVFFVEIQVLVQYVPGKPETDTKSAKLRFIFSHSALREGWDNPNFFQILTITTLVNDLTRRQKIGRGLRIAVNQDDQRVYGDQNVVTIYANETFEDFANGLQDEYIQSGLLVNKIEANFFAGTVVDKSQPVQMTTNENGVIETENSYLDDQERTKETITVTSEDSEKFVTVLKKTNVIKNDGIPQIKAVGSLQTEGKQADVIQSAIEMGLDQHIAAALVEQMRIKFKVPEVTNRNQRETVELTDKNNAYFQDLWDKIAHKVNYWVRFKENELIGDVVNGRNPLRDIHINEMTAVQTRARIKLSQTRVNDEVVNVNTEHLTWEDLPIIDITRQLADKLGLTRQTIIKMILQSQKQDHDFLKKIKQNPALFMRRALSNIRLHQRKLLNHSLVYVQNGELWPKDKLKPFEASGKNLWKVHDRGFVKTLYKQIFFQSNEETKFAESLVNEKKSSIS